MCVCVCVSKINYGYFLGGLHNKDCSILGSIFPPLFRGTSIYVCIYTHTYIYIYIYVGGYTIAVQSKAPVNSQEKSRVPSPAIRVRAAVSYLVLTLL